MSSLRGPSNSRSYRLNGEVVRIRPLPLSRLSAEEAITKDDRIPYVDPEIPENIPGEQRQSGIKIENEVSVCTFGSLQLRAWDRAGRMEGSLLQS
jgi:hypothetical protein